ncbi:ImmA/IrrE family metallo-endopeptidase [Phaeobacter sp. HF9A]|uniref:ImmA/IrrE family metallo-endopeptidase n=1 Tax=Phaeobacter sp. HF9A TaxID=2721561 RepID=UPI0014320868|nr:ImmA/IrrE family metallo-endopeptidase [Phaeobacter sp. HF9A]
MPTYSNPTPTNWYKGRVEEFAEQVRSQLGYETGSSLKEMLSSHGANISYTASSFDDHESGSLIARSIDDFDIYLSPNTSVERDNFTLAHELAHLIMHFDGEGEMRATRYVTDDPIQKRAEWEANWFAAAFLMPAADFKEFYLNSDGDLKLVADHFNVSISAADVRARALDLQ